MFVCNSISIFPKFVDAYMHVVDNLIDGVLTCQQFNKLIKNPVEGKLIN